VKLLLAYWLAFVVVFAASMVAHDVFAFANVRECLYRSIENLSESERHPAERVRTVFDLDADHFYGSVAFSMYRDEFFRHALDKHFSFHRNKIPATLTWTLALWLSVDRRQVESYQLRRRGADEVSISMFGKGLNALTERQLKEVRRAANRRSADSVCT
jgi:hypothetical protein